MSYIKEITVEINEEEVDLTVEFFITPGEEQTFWEPGYPPEIDNFIIEDAEDLEFTIIELEDAIFKYIDKNEDAIIDEAFRAEEEQRGEYLFDQMIDRLWY